MWWSCRRNLNLVRHIIIVRRPVVARIICRWIVPSGPACWRRPAPAMHHSSTIYLQSSGCHVRLPIGCHSITYMTDLTQDKVTIFINSRGLAVKWPIGVPLESAWGFPNDVSVGFAATAPLRRISRLLVVDCVSHYTCVDLSLYFCCLLIQNWVH